MLMAGIGLDASVVRRVQPSLKKRIGKGAFWISGFSHLATGTLGHSRSRSTMTNTPQRLRRSVKRRRYGGDLAITPGARLDQPEFEICIIETLEPPALPALLSHAMRNGMPRDNPKSSL